MYRWQDGSWWLVHLRSAPKPDPASSGRRLLVGTHQSAIEHEIVVVGVRAQGGEDSFPDAGLGPAREALRSSICHSAQADRTSGRPSAAPTKHRSQTDGCQCPCGTDRPALPGSKSAIRRHRVSLSSYRLTIVEPPDQKNLEVYESHTLRRVTPECRLDLAGPPRGAETPLILPPAPSKSLAAVSPSSRGPGHHSFKVETRVRFP